MACQPCDELDELKTAQLRFQRGHPLLSAQTVVQLAGLKRKIYPHARHDLPVLLQIAIFDEFPCLAVIQVSCAARVAAGGVEREDSLAAPSEGTGGRRASQRIENKVV